MWTTSLVTPMSKPKKRTKTELSVESGQIVHPSSKQTTHHTTAQPIDRIPEPVAVVRTDRATGKVTHRRGLEIKSN